MFEKALLFWPLSLSLSLSLSLVSLSLSLLSPPPPTYLRFSEKIERRKVGLVHGKKFLDEGLEAQCCEKLWKDGDFAKHSASDRLGDLVP